MSAQNRHRLVKSIISVSSEYKASLPKSKISGTLLSFTVTTFYQNKKSLTVNDCQGRIITNYPRCHLDSRDAVRLSDTDISVTTDVCRTLQNTLRVRKSHAFDCTLSGPFDNLYLTRLSAPRALCKGICCLYLRVNGLKIWDNYITMEFLCQAFDFII